MVNIGLYDLLQRVRFGWHLMTPDRGNGCLKVVPGSHKNAVHFKHKVEHRKNLVLNQAIKDDRVDETETEYIELKAGQFSLHDVYLVHGSDVNTSGRDVQASP